ncbi:MAG: hypothetical protein JW929_11445 [Anaerolineales bacterium]|nr:hypothetical protein [Anaerolineales bacterium]
MTGIPIEGFYYFFFAAYRFLFDSRDRGAAEHTAAPQGADGIWRCRTIFQCTVACPREIKVTKAVVELKGKLIREAVG